jgi:hypothetical protein
MGKFQQVNLTFEIMTKNLKLKCSSPQNNQENFNNFTENGQVDS